MDRRAGPRVRPTTRSSGAAHGPGPYERPDDLPDGGRRSWPTTAGRLVPGPGRVRPPGPGTPFPARPPAPARQRRAPQRHQGPRAVPAGGADGAGRRAAEIFAGGPLPSPYMLFVHDVAPQWRDRLAAVDPRRPHGPDPDGRPHATLAAMLRAFDRRTGVPVVVNTSLNTAGRPMVDSPRDALELFGSAPVDALAIGPFLSGAATMTPARRHPDRRPRLCARLARPRTAGGSTARSDRGRRRPAVAARPPLAA